MTRLSITVTVPLKVVHRQVLKATDTVPVPARHKLTSAISERSNKCLTAETGKIAVLTSVDKLFHKELYCYKILLFSCYDIVSTQLLER